MFTWLIFIHFFQEGKPGREGDYSNLALWTNPSGMITVYIANSGGAAYMLIDSISNIAASQWTAIRIEWTADPKKIELFVDGVSKGSDTSGSGTFSSCAGNDLAIVIGGKTFWRVASDPDAYFYSGGFVGQIDNVTIRLPPPEGTVMIVR